MRLSVKVLGGVECCVDAKDNYTVEQLKADIEAKLKLGKTGVAVVVAPNVGTLVCSVVG